MKISCEIIGKVDSGDVSKISMENNNGVVISTLTTGATLQEFLDRHVSSCLPHS